MIKDLKVSGKYTATCTAIRQSGAGEDNVEHLEAKAKDLQTALSDLREKACVNGRDYEEFDKLSIPIVFADREDQPKVDPVQGVPYHVPTIHARE